MPVFYTGAVVIADTVRRNMGISSEALATAMGEALRCAREAERNADVPVGAVMLDRDGAIAARSYNRREQKGDPLSHAEIEVIRAAAAVNGSWNLAEFTLVVTLEPCPMCAGAAVSAHVGSIVFGAWDPKMGACGSVWDIPRDPHIGTHPQVAGGIREEECSRLLGSFFEQRRPCSRHHPGSPGRPV